MTEVGEGKAEIASNFGDAFLIQKEETGAPRQDYTGRLLGSPSPRLGSMSPAQVAPNYNTRRAERRPSIEKFSHSKERKLRERRENRRHE